MDRIKNNKIIKLISPFIKNKQAFIVGGFIRDLIMGINSPDIDLIICDNDVKNFSMELAKKINAHFIELDNENFIYRIVLDDKINYIDITKPIENDFEKDILRRDLTINAIAYDINNEKIIDLTNGIKDIQNGIIKGISNKNFLDDPLRFLRIFRFAAKTGFSISSDLIELTKKFHHLINKCAKERINNELMKMFEGKYIDTALLKMEETGLLTEIFPIYNEVKKIPPNTHHHLDLIHHLIETTKQIQMLYETSSEEVKKHLETIAYGGIKQIAYLKLSGFLHDIGKPYCWTIDKETNRHRFINHDEIGADLCVPILRDLKFSKKQIDYIKTLIKYHIYPSSMMCAKDVNEKAYYRFYRKMKDKVIDVIILAMADRLSAKGEQVTKEMIENNINLLTFLLNNYIKIKETLKPLPKLIDGNEIMEILSIKQSPILGKIINSLKEAQISGEIKTKEEAVFFVKKFNPQI